MPTPKDRDAIERSLVRKVSAALAGILRGLRILLEDSTPPTDTWWDEQSEALSVVLVPELEKAAHAGYDAVGFPSDDTPIRDAIDDWLLVHGPELIKGLTDVSREALADAIGDFFEGEGVTLQDVVDRIEPYFGADRTMRIAVTETTRAYDLGDQVATQELRDAGFIVKDIWNTNMDSLVDPDCLEREGKESKDWPTPDRPPLHPNCRCWVTHSIL